MATGSAENLKQEERNEELLNSVSPTMSSEWQLDRNNLVNSSMGLVPSSNPMEVCKSHMIDSPCSSVPMVNTFSPPIWDLPISGNLELSDINVQQNPSNSNSFGNRQIGMGLPGASIDKALGMGCAPPDPVLKGGMFLPSVPGMLPEILAQIPADSGFIDRAARFSCFNGGNFGSMMNPLSIAEPIDPYFRSLGSIERPQEISAGNRLRSMANVQPQKNQMKLTANLEDVSLRIEHVETERSLFNSESIAWFQDEANQGGGASEKRPEKAGFSGRGGQELEGGDGESSAMTLGSKKRRRICKDAGVDESKPQPSTEETSQHNKIQQNEDENTTSTTRPGGENGKQGPKTSDPPKEEYIHVRARRGQATNSHSLAERVRREKISERMKFLQDLVPGCSKVTGKAVMLDEIINYVQSLQRQVEFLSMKLATVNPRLDFNIESLLTKDILQSGAGCSSSLAFPHNMNLQYPPLHPPATCLIQSGPPGLGSSSDSLRRSISSQFTNVTGGYKEPPSQVPGAWEDELHNIVHMGLNSTAALSSQDLSASLPPDHMKAEL